LLLAAADSDGGGGGGGSGGSGSGGTASGVCVNVRRLLSPLAVKNTWRVWVPEQRKCRKKKKNNDSHTYMYMKVYSNIYVYNKYTCRVVVIKNRFCL
jgi:hypothetical protein